MITRTTWPDLPDALRAAVRRCTGRIDAVTPVQAGLNSSLAATLHTGTETIFIKAIPGDHPQARSQQREADINPYVVPVAPRLLWRITMAGWDVLGFEHIDGRHADLSPASPDLPKIADALAELYTIAAPDLSLRRFEDRWGGHIATENDRELLRGHGLLHTDMNPGNILITEDSARITDWAWPSRGASWIDPAGLALWLIHAGHTPRQAEAWIGHLAACAALDKAALDTFTIANTRLWAEIAHNDASPWKQAIAATARRWQDDRAGRHGRVPPPTSRPSTPRAVTSDIGARRAPAP